MLVTQLWTGGGGEEGAAGHCQACHYHSYNLINYRGKVIKSYLRVRYLSGLHNNIKVCVLPII